MCSTCPARDQPEPGAWFNHIWLLYQLKKAGYPFDKDELDLVEWLAIYELETALDAPIETAPVVPGDQDDNGE